jgi:hypothetical protein
MYQCECCGLVVDKITEWKENECPEDDMQHHWKAVEISDIHLKGKYVIMKTKASLNLDIIDWVYFCKFGNGCNPEASGTKIFGHFVTDPEKVYMRRYDVVRLASDDEVKQAQERFRNNKTWALEKWKGYQVDRKKTVLDILKERGGFE